MNSQGAHDDLASRYGKEPVTRTAAEWLWALLPIGGSVFCLSALVYYHLHHDELAVASTLQVLIAGLYRFLGFAPAFLFFLLLLSWSSIWFVVGRIDRPLGRLLRLGAMTVMLGVLMNLGEGRAEPAFRKGELGAWLAEHLVDSFGYYPSLVMVWAVTFGALLLATDYFFSEYFERLRPREESSADAGVEQAVTDHLKQLATVPEPSAEPRRELAPPVAIAPGPGRDGDAIGAESSRPALQGAATADDAEVDVEPVVDVAIEPAVYRPRRRSYFERRQAEVESDSAVDRLDETWVPTGPDAQEIENPESGVPAPVVESTAESSGEPARVGAAEEAVAGATSSTPESTDDAARALPTIEADSIDAAESPEEPVRDEPIVPIPRPEVQPEQAGSESVIVPSRDPEAGRERDAVRQQVLFGGNLDDALVAEAVEVVTTWRRASATFLQRKLRIDYDLACRLLVELARRGIVELEADATHGRVLV